MGKLTKTKDLNKQLFEQCPIWVWDEAKEYLVPISKIEPQVPEDMGELFIQAKFRTPGGIIFDGYIVGQVTYHAFFIFVENEEVGFNVNLKEYWKADLLKIFKLLRKEPFLFFPLKYYTNFILSNGGGIEGEFNSL